MFLREGIVEIEVRHPPLQKKNQIVSIVASQCPQSFAIFRLSGLSLAATPEQPIVGRLP
jgi:hypothetical protein